MTIAIATSNDLNRPIEWRRNTGSSEEAHILERNFAQAWKHFSVVPASSPAGNAALSLQALADRCAKEGWDGYDAAPINPEAILEAERFLSVLPRHIPAPGVDPEPDGEIALEWYRSPTGVFSISFSGTGVISYAGLFGRSNRTHGTEVFDDRIPSSIIQFILRVAPRRDRR